MNTETRERLNDLAAAATAGPWSIYPQTVVDRDEAKRELCLLVDGTPTFVPVLYMIEADGLAPALTGCGEASAANAAFIAAARTAVPELLAAIDQLEAEHNALLARLEAAEAAAAAMKQAALAVLPSSDTLDFYEKVIDMQDDYAFELVAVDQWQKWLDLRAATRNVEDSASS